MPIANGTISPDLLTLAYRYVSAIVPLTSLLVLHAYGPRSVDESLNHTTVTGDFITLKRQWMCTLYR